MEEMKKPNQSIACTVSQCAHHAKNCNYCVLEKVSIGTHEANPTVIQCVDCESFVLGDKKSECKGSDCK